ncbi:hypothetical protein MNBD_GAMMA20-482 [hydrothermal vent metagenome]|uniref:Uncharacterized protein n=1 Tax=hydrothermal vent metagenome TaxID=652676 RepID=A0A3B1BA65_9ZZZZ
MDAETARFLTENQLGKYWITENEAENGENSRKKVVK